MMRPLVLVTVLLLAGCAEPRAAETPTLPQAASDAPPRTQTQAGSFETAFTLRSGGGTQTLVLSGTNVFTLGSPASSLRLTLAWDATPAQPFELALALAGGSVVGRAAGESPLALDVGDAAPGDYHVLVRPERDPGVSLAETLRWNATATLRSPSSTPRSER